MLLVVAALTGAVTLAEVYRLRFRFARVFAMAAVAVVVTGWGVGQYAWILVDELDQRCRRHARHPDRAARRRCAGCGPRPPRADIPVMAHPDRGMEPDLMRYVQRYK